MRLQSTAPKNNRGMGIFIVALCICLVLPLGIGTFAGSQGLKPIHVSLKATVDTPQNPPACAFELQPALTNPEQDPVAGPVVLHPDGDGTIHVLGNLAYTAPGTYQYVLQQISAPLPGALFDSSVYVIDVSVTSADNKLRAELHAADADGRPVDISSIRFSNEYSPDQASALLGGSQVLLGDILKADEFAYLVRATDASDEEGTPIAASDMPLPEALTATNTVAGSFSFGTITFTTPGTYTYRISQSEALSPGIEPDSSVYTAEIMVTRNSEGILTASSTIRDQAGISCENAVFSNTAETPTLELRLEQALNTGAFTTGSLEGHPGDAVHYRLTVHNTSHRDASGVAVNHPVPDGLVVDAGSLPTGTELADNVIFWPVGSLPAMASQTIEFKTTIPEMQDDRTWTSFATVDFTNNLNAGVSSRAAGTSEVIDSNPLEVTGIAARKVLQAAPTNFIAASLEGDPQLTILKEQCLNDGFFSSDLMHTAAGDIATYRITLMNSSTVPAQNVNITDTIPSGLTLVTNSITDGGLETNGVVTWNLGTLDAGLSKSVSFQVQFPAATQFTTWTNTAMFNFQGHAYESSNSVSFDQTPGVTPTNTPAPTVTPTPVPTATPVTTPIPTVEPTIAPSPTPVPGSSPHTNDGIHIAIWVILATGAGIIAYVSIRKLRKQPER